MPDPGMGSAAGRRVEALPRAEGQGAGLLRRLALGHAGREPLRSRLAPSQNPVEHRRAASRRAWQMPQSAPISGHGHQALFASDLSRAPDAAGPSGAARTACGRSSACWKTRRFAKLERGAGAGSRCRSDPARAPAILPRPDARAPSPRPASPHRCRHLRQPEELAGGADRDRRRQCRGRRRLFGQGRQCLRRRPPARPSCREDDGDGLLPVQQRRDRRPPCAEEAWRRARRHRRLGRPSRQRHAGHLLGRSHRCSTARRTRCRSIPAPAPRTRPAPATSSMRRFRRAPAATMFRDAFLSACCRRSTTFRPDLIIISAGFDAHHRDPLAEINLTEEDFDWATGQLMERATRHARAGSSACSKAATICRAWHFRSPPMSGA